MQLICDGTNLKKKVIWSDSVFSVFPMVKMVQNQSIFPIVLTRFYIEFAMWFDSDFVFSDALKRRTSLVTKTIRVGNGQMDGGYTSSLHRICPSIPYYDSYFSVFQHHYIMIAICLCVLVCPVRFCDGNLVFSLRHYDMSLEFYII